MARQEDRQARGVCGCGVARHLRTGNRTGEWHPSPEFGSARSTARERAGPDTVALPYPPLYGSVTTERRRRTRHMVGPRSCGIDRCLIPAGPGRQENCICMRSTGRLRRRPGRNSAQRRHRGENFPFLCSRTRTPFFDSLYITQNHFLVSLRF
jgi:hypothetical protein